MDFNVEKCVTMHIGSKNIKFQYNIQGRQLDTMKTTRNFGVQISSTLKSADHCHESYCKANQLLGLTKKTIKHRNPALMVRLYKSLVRPHLEYYSSVWSPHYRKKQDAYRKKI